MSIVLNEHEWAEEMIMSRSIGKKPSETFCRVARYYIDKGYTKKEVRDFMDSFLLRCEPNASLPKWSDSLDYALNRALKYKAVMIDSIDITKPEMDIINSVDGVQLRRLVFTLLCLSKYWNEVIPGCDYWVNSKDTEIMHMANINTSIKRQGAMYSYLRDAGLIQFSKKIDNTSVKVLFNCPGDIVLKVTDFRNLGYQYMMYCGGPYFECENCGITTKKREPGRGRNQKYCKECAVLVNTQQRVNSVMRQRQSVKKCTC